MEHLTLRNNFAVTKKFLITKFDSIKKKFSPSSSSSHSPIKFFLRSSIFFSCSLAISSFFFLEIRGFFSWGFVVEAVEVSGLATLGVALGVFLALLLAAFGVVFFSAGALGVFGVLGVLGTFKYSIGFSI